MSVRLEECSQMISKRGRMITNEGNYQNITWLMLRLSLRVMVIMKRLQVSQPQPITYVK